MIDFTLTAYHSLLEAIQAAGYVCQSVEGYMDAPGEKRLVILRHDVDRRPENALAVAELEHKVGIKSSYYFRTVKQVFKEDVIQKIARLGHEIGYHYENLSHCSGDFGAAIADFEQNLERLRRLYPVRTVCMHGSPLSRLDNRKIWDKYEYRDYGIIAEPYFDMDFNRVFYLSDTGRAWNDPGASFRDKVDSHFHIPVKSTGHLIKRFEKDELPDHVMINTHPQRWTYQPVSWTKELVGQSARNIVKRVITRFA